MNSAQLRQKTIELSDPSMLSYEFKHPPLLVAGMAMMYYGLRESEKDVDFILHSEDHKNLALSLKNPKILEGSHESGYKKTPELVDLYSDHGIIIYKFEIWDSIYLFKYEDLIEGAVREGDFLVIGLEKLLMLCAVRGLKEERYMDDAKLIAQELTRQRYEKFDENEIGKFWTMILGK